MLVYIAGPGAPTEGYTVERNCADALEVYFTLIKAGINCFCPHASILEALSKDITYERWLQYDFAMIDVCTHVLMLPRWETSPGACREREYAELIGRIVLYEMPECE